MPDVAAERVARLATVDRNGRPHIVPICFVLDGETLYTAVDEKPKRTRRLKRLENIEANPHVALSISDPDDPYRYLEVRGVVEEIVPDPTGAFYLHLNDRYTGPLTEPPVDKADRVILVVRPTGYSKQ